MAELNPEDTEFGKEFADNWNELQNILEEVQELESELKKDPTNPKLKSELDRQKQLEENKQQNCLESIAKSVGVEDTEFLGKMDFEKPWTQEAQGLSNWDANQMEDMKTKLESKINNKLNLADINGFLTDFQTDIQEIVQNYERTGKLEISRSKWERMKDWYNENLADKITWDNFKILAKFALLGLAIWGVVKVVDFFKGMACQMAKSDSGCYYITSSGQDKVTIISGNIPPGQKCDYNDCCGGCNTGELQQSCYTGCCNARLDADASSHTGGHYSYECESAMGATLNFLKGVGDIFNPKSILKDIEYIAIIVGALIGLVILIYIGIKAVSYFSSKSEE